jgi:hypothetical protein
VGASWSDAIRREDIQTYELGIVVAFGAIRNSEAANFLGPHTFDEEDAAGGVGHDTVPLMRKGAHGGAEFCARISAMRVFWGLLLIHTMTGCSTTPPATEVPVVSVEATLDHIRQSYILGCSEALRGEGKKNFYIGCRDKGIKHSDAVRKLLETPSEVE